MGKSEPPKVLVAPGGWYTGPVPVGEFGGGLPRGSDEVYGFVRSMVNEP